MLTILYFARLRECTGVACQSIALPVGVRDVAGLLDHLRAADARLALALAPGSNFRAAVNQQMATAAAPVSDGDEVAFFPPVTGG
jgi:molybdopterin synthase sulfur carrier subunit